MSTTIDVICYKYKVLKNNEHPLMLRLTKDQKTIFKPQNFNQSRVFGFYQKQAEMKLSQ